MQDKLFHIKANNLNLTAGGDAVAFEFVPFEGKRFIPLIAVVEVKKVTLGGTQTAPHITIDNGTTGQNIVADVALGVTPNRSQVLVVIGGRIVDHDNPLRINRTTAAAGSTGTSVYKADVDIIGLFK